MNKGLKITGKVALFIVTPTVLLILFFIFTWIYRKYYSKKYTEEALNLWKKYFNEKDIRIVDLYGKDAVINDLNVESYFKDLFTKENLSVDPEILITETKEGNTATVSYGYKENGNDVKLTYSLGVKTFFGKPLIVTHH
jgi:hypothetical protein